MQTNSGQERYSLLLWVVMLALLCGPAAAKDSGLSLLLLPPIAGEGNPQLAISWKGVAAGRIDLDVIDEAGDQRRLMSRLLDPGMHVEDVDVSGTDRRLVAVLRDTQAIEIARAETTVSAVLPPLDVGAPEMAGANDAPPSPAIERLGTTVDWKATFGGNIGPNREVVAMTTFDDGSGPALVVVGPFLSAGGSSANQIARWNGVSWSSFGSDGGSGFNGAVYTVAVFEGDLYVGGWFTEANMGGAAVQVRNIARWNGRDWSAVGSGAGNGVNDRVFALLALDGELYAGGWFTEANVGGATVQAGRVARWNGSRWASLGDGGIDSPGQANALVAFRGEIYVGGDFSRVTSNGVTTFANSVARWNPTTSTWSTVGTGAGNGVSGRVNALAVWGKDLYVGGQFNWANDDGLEVAADRIARWNGTTWTVLGSAGGNGLDGGSFNTGHVSALAVMDGALYVGGRFTRAKSGLSVVMAKNVVRWDGTTWTPLGNGIGADENADVRTLAAMGGQLFVGGWFNEASVGATATVADNVVSWSGSAWVRLGEGDNAVDGTVSDLAVVDGELYVAGGFFRAASTLTTNGIARWNGNHWSTLGTGGGSGVNGSVVKLANVAGDLYLVGSFTKANVGGTEVIANNIVRWDGSNWSSIGSAGGNGLNGTAVDIVAVDNEVFVGGAFTRANVGGPEVAANRVARWNGASWSAVGTGSGNGVNGNVHALASLNGAIYAGGNFTEANLGGASVAANYIARWNGANWSILGTGGGNGLNGPVLALATLSGELYVGGSFTRANIGGTSVPVNNIARWSGGNWSALGSNGGIGVNQGVTVLTALAGELYVGGLFTRANIGGPAVRANRIARWNGREWSAFHSGIDPSVQFFTPQVLAMAIYNGDLIAGGWFATAGNSASNFIAAYGSADSTSTWITSSLPSPSFPGDAVQIRVRVEGDTAPTIGHVTVTGAPGGSCSDLTLTPINGTTSEAECTIRWSTVGTRTLTARYIGGKDWLPSTSAPFAHAVTDLLFGNGFETSP